MSFCKYFSYLNIFISSFLSFFSTNSCKTFLRIVIGHIDLGWVFILIRSVKPIFTLNLKKKKGLMFHFTLIDVGFFLCQNICISSAVQTGAVVAFSAILFL